MYLVLIAWFYVALMMAVAEATSPVGTVLGAFLTFLLYGALPMGVVGYIMGSPARKRARLAQQEAASTPGEAIAKASTLAPNTSRETASHTIAAVRKEP